MVESLDVQKEGGWQSRIDLGRVVAQVGVVSSETFQVEVDQTVEIKDDSPLDHGLGRLRRFVEGRKKSGQLATALEGVLFNLRL